MAQLVLEAYPKGHLDDDTWLKNLVNKRWKLAVITLEEDKKLNSKARSKAFNTPEERWEYGGIEFPADTKKR